MSWVRSPSPAPLSASSRGLYPSVTTLLFGAQNPGRTVTRIFVPLFRPSTDSGTPRRTALRSRSTFGNQPFIWSELSRSSPFEIDGSRTCRLTYLPCALRSDVPISIRSQHSRSAPFEIEGSRTCRLTYLPCALRTDVPISIRPITYSAPPVPRSPDTPDLGESPAFGLLSKSRKISTSAETFFAPLPKPPRYAPTGFG